MIERTPSAGLPIHAVPAAAVRRAERPTATLRIEGLVARPRALTAAALADLPRADLIEDFTCEEGWSAPEQHWRGIRLTDLLALADPSPTARYVRVCAGGYAVPLPRDVAAAALLCDELNGQPLTAESGAPWRLVVPGGACYSSVKWVSRIELAAEAGDPSGERIARARAGLAPAEADSLEDATR